MTNKHQKSKQIRKVRTKKSRKLILKQSKSKSKKMANLRKRRKPSSSRSRPTMYDSTSNANIRIGL